MSNATDGNALTSGAARSHLPSHLPSSDEALHRLFDHSLQGWSLQDAVVWMLTCGKLIEDNRQFVGALCERLIRAGAPVSRVRVAMSTLNPQVKALRLALWVSTK